MGTKDQETIIYGAEANSRFCADWQQKLHDEVKRALLYLIYRRQLSRDDYSKLDYRDYLSAHSFNMGDVAIADTVSAFVREAFAETNFDYVNWGELRQVPALSSVQSDAEIIIAGSGYISLDHDNRLANRIDKDRQLIKDTHARPVLFGIGVNRPHYDLAETEEPVIDGTDEQILSDFLSMCRSISVRDTFSQNLLQRYTEKKVELIGDPALHYASLHQVRRKPDAINGKLKHPVIGINFNFHGPTSNAIMRKNLKAYITVLKEIQQTTGCSYRYFVHHESAEAIPKLMAAKHLHVKVIRGNPAKLFADYVELDLHIGGMLHSCIFAHSVDVPSIALAYDIKHHGFFELFGLEENCLSSINFEPDALKERVYALLADSEPTIRIIREKRQELEMLTRNFTQSLNLTN